MPMKPPQHYGREAYQLLDAMREQLEEDDTYPDSLAEDVEETMRHVRAEYQAAADYQEGVVDADL